MTPNLIERIGHFLPGLQALLQYERGSLRPDFVAGFSVAAVALPVGIAYAEIAGVPTVVGIYSAIFPLLAYALFGSSRQLMTGPDAATCIMVAASLGPLAGGDPERYLALLFVLTLMTGVFYVVAGLGRLGFIANFLSQPILVGYLNGIALIILVGQLPKLFGYASEASDFFPKVLEFFQKLDTTHLPTLVLGVALLLLLLTLRRLAPNWPGALIAAIVGIVVVASLDLQAKSVAVLGQVNAGFPTLQWLTLSFQEFKELFRDAAGIMLISFTSGILTAKSFARRNRYDIDANQELIAFGACNLTSGLVQGFPVTGTSSRTAVNDAMGGKTQLAGIVAAAAMLLFLLFMAAPLAYLPNAALAAIIMVSVLGLFDVEALKELRGASRRELLFSLGTTLGVLLLGVLPGVVLAVILSLLWLLSVGSRPHDAILGRVAGLEEFHSTADHPRAETIPGLLLYRFESSLVFYNTDYLKERVRAAISASETPIEWIVIDASPINVIDFTALQKLEELRQELADRGVVLIYARAKRSLLDQFFRSEQVSTTRERIDRYSYPTLRSAVQAFEKRAESGDGAGRNSS